MSRPGLPPSDGSREAGTIRPDREEHEDVSAPADLPQAPGEWLYGGWLTTELLAGLLNVDASTVRRWRTADPLQGPPFVRLSERVTIYSAADVEAWLRKHRIDPAAAA